MTLVTRLIELEEQYRKLLKKTGCTFQPFPTFDDFPQPGCANVLYIDESTDPNEAWRWDKDTQTYIQVGGTAEDPVVGPGIQFSQFSSAFETTFQILTLTALTDTPQIVPFDIVVNEGTHVTGDINTFQFTVNETGWYNFYFDCMFTFAAIGTANMIGQIYINDAYVDYQTASKVQTGGANNIFHMSMTRKMSLAQGDVVDFRVSRNFLSGPSDVTFNNVEMSLERISLGGIILGGDNEIQVSTNYAALPDPGTETNLWRWVVNTVGNDPSGLYYSDGITWETADSVWSLFPAISTVDVAGNQIDNAGHINMDPNQALIFDNGSRVQEGTHDPGNGGSGGVELECAVGYRAQWDAGCWYLRSNDGMTIIITSNQSAAPLVTDDSAKGYAVNSIYAIRTQVMYICTDATVGAAVWEIYAPKADLVGGKVPAAQLPSYVDDIINGYLDTGIFYEEVGLITPITGETGKIYVDLLTDKIYRWSGIIYAEVSPSALQVNADWNAVGGVAEILNKPSIPAAQVSSDWNSVVSPTEILNKPSTFAPSAHASSHTNGTDDIQDATALQKGLATAAQISKLDGIAAGAEVNVNADWNSVAGDSEILNKPTIPAAQVSSDWNSVVSPTEILNKPTIPVKTIVAGVSLLAANFSLNAGYYEYNYANVLIGVSSMVTVTPLNSTISIVSAAVFLPQITVTNGNAKLFCTNLPSGNMDVDVWILT